MSDKFENQESHQLEKIESDHAQLKISHEKIMTDYEDLNLNYYSNFLDEHTQLIQNLTVGK